MCERCGRTGREPTRSRAHRAGPRRLLLGDEDPLAPRRRPRRARARPSAASWPSAPSTRGSLWKLTGGARARDRRHQRVAHALPGPRARVDWDDEMLALLGVPRAMLPAGPPVRRRVRRDGGPRLAPARACRSRGSRATSRPRSSARRASRRAAPRTRTAPAASSLAQHGRRRPCVSRPRAPDHVAWQIGGTTTYALEGSVFIAGAAVQWLRDGLGIIARTRARAQALARVRGRHRRRVFVPAFVGLGAPYWDPDARGTIVGITRGTTRAHLARAALEAIAYQSRDVLEAMAADAGARVRALRVDGGAVANDFLCQFQADVLDAARPSARGSSRRRRWAPPSWPGSAPACGARWTPSPNGRRSSARSCPRWMRRLARNGIDRWRRAVERARQWAA